MVSIFLSVAFNYTTNHFYHLIDRKSFYVETTPVVVLKLIIVSKMLTWVAVTPVNKTKEVILCPKKE